MPEVTKPTPFAFTPADGFKNTASFPDPATETDARAQIQSLLDQTRDAVNSLATFYATYGGAVPGAKTVGVNSINGVAGNDVQTVLENIKTIIDNLVLGQIPPGQYASSGDLTAHTSNTNNPHQVTASQVGAASSGDVQTAKIRSYMGV